MRLPSFPPRLEEWLPHKKVPVPSWMVEEEGNSWHIGVPFPFISYFDPDRKWGAGPIPPNYWLKVIGGKDEDTLYVGIPCPGLVYQPAEGKWGISALAPNGTFKITE